MRCFLLYPRYRGERRCLLLVHKIIASLLYGIVNKEGVWIGEEVVCQGWELWGSGRFHTSLGGWTFKMSKKVSLSQRAYYEWSWDGLECLGYLRAKDQGSWSIILPRWFVWREDWEIPSLTASIKSPTREWKRNKISAELMLGEAGKCILNSWW